jgi:hypothetical protein
MDGGRLGKGGTEQRKTKQATCLIHGVKNKKKKKKKKKIIED